MEDGISTVRIAHALLVFCKVKDRSHFTVQVAMTAP